MSQGHASKTSEQTSTYLNILNKWPFNDQNDEQHDDQTDDDQTDDDDDDDDDSDDRGESEDIWRYLKQYSRI